MSSGCILNVYPNHALPEPGFNYFTVPKVAGNLTDNPTPQSEHLLVCIPSYNEISKDLMKTLMSVHEQAVGLPETRVSCLIILDGWRMSHSSMRQTLAGLMGETCVVRDEYGKCRERKVNLFLVVCLTVYVLQKIGDSFFFYRY